MTFGQRLGGSENILWALLRNLDRDRVRPSVVFLEPGPFEAEVAALGIPTRVIATGRFRQLRRGAAAVRRLARVLDEETPDLIVNWFSRSHVYGACAALLAGHRRRMIWWQHRLAEPWTLDTVATLLPACAIGTSSEGSRQAQLRLRPRRLVFRVNPGIDDPPRSSPGELTGLRASLGIPAGRPVVGIVGRLQPWKGQHFFLDALARRRDLGVDTHGLMVGGNAYDLAPGYEPLLHRRARELGIEERVTFTGQVPDARRYLQLMDVSVNASTDEPFGLGIVESMALEVPVVTFDGPGPREIVASGETGYVVAPGDTYRMSKRLGELLRDDALRRRFAQAGRARYLERFTARHMVEEVERWFRHLAHACPSDPNPEHPR